ncbi:VOC family protein [Microbacterium hominis]|uniref:VOC family protein n=1 Tax=Microbacterium hominis TaxID=162426 RepID=A0A7D4U9K8_9MICO|nr:VOC family protein [Microbacterium hominis]QKJ20826.1 VOC family protein [Microbacterium hominis]
MFDNSQPFGSFAVSDLDAAAEFYGNTLGLDVDVDKDMQSMALTLPNGGRHFIYAKEGHAPANFTVFNFAVDDVEAAVDELNGRGVVTKIYTDPDYGTDEKGISRGFEGGPDIAWFMDPSGNVISIMKFV